MKNFYACKHEDNQPLCRQLYLTLYSLCFLMGLLLSNTAHAGASAIETANSTFKIAVWAPETGNILDCYTKVVKIESYISYYDGDPNDIKNLTYKWTGPNGFTSNSKDISVTVGGYYELLVKSETGLYSIYWITVYGGGYYENFAGSDLILNSTDSTLKLGGYAHGLNGTVHQNYTVSWEASNGGNIVSGENTLTPIVDAPGTYTITLTHFSGCTMQDSMVVIQPEENTLEANIKLTSQLEFKCTGSATSISMIAVAILNGKPTKEGITYQWSGPNGYTANTEVGQAAEPGTYTLTVTDTVHHLTASVSHTFMPPYVPTGSGGPDKKLTCQNSTVKLEGSGLDAHYIQWYASDGGNIVSGARSLRPLLMLQEPIEWCSPVSIAVANLKM